MEIIKVKIEDLKPYENNAKIHTEHQIEQIKHSILEFGFNDPIAIDENNVIIEGHGRYIALQELDYDEVECIRLTNLTEEQKKAYTLIHNKLTMNTNFDIDTLQEELNNIIDLDMSDFGFFKLEDIDWEDVEDLSDETYEEPEHKMLECPSCHHIDRDIHFKKIKGE